MNKTNKTNKSKNNLKKNNKTIVNEHNFSNIITSNGYNCIGPCYPANTVYYNPFTLTAIKAQFPTCPIKKEEIDIEGEKVKIFADKCNISDINEEYMNFDIFDDTVQIANSSDNFLKQIYEIYNISDVVIFLNDSIDIMPIYSQKRILESIFDVYYKYIEFPKQFFSDKINKVLVEIYNINKISSKDIIKELNKISLDSSSDIQDIYTHLIKKFSKSEKNTK